MNKLTLNIIHFQSRTLTLGLVLVLSLLSLTASAQNTVFRYNSSSGEEPTAQGTDIGAVQIADGAASGDVIKVSQGATFNTTVTNPVSVFIIEADSGNPVNVSVGNGYDFGSLTHNVNAAFENVSFTGKGDNSHGVNDSFMYGDTDSSINVTFNNAAFSNFATRVYENITTLQGNVTFKNNSAPYVGDTDLTDLGGAIKNLDSLVGTVSGNKITFDGNHAGSGGAIYSLNNLNCSENEITFSNNKAYNRENDGGAIYYLNKLDGYKNAITFSENRANNHGGSIYHLDKWGGEENEVTFTNNYSECYGGAVYWISEFNGSKNTITFSKNTSDYGPAVYRFDKLEGSKNIITFSENRGGQGSGAIDELTVLGGSENEITFSNNIGDIGGAVSNCVWVAGECLTITGNKNTITFSGNTAGAGGAIYSGVAVSITCDNSGDNTEGNYNNIIKFENNTASGSGGAICVSPQYLYDSSVGGIIDFSGNNKVTFTGNKASGKGNDIYLWGTTSNPAKLSFSGGVYSFDGGIWLGNSYYDRESQTYIDTESGNTIITGGANVTIAGRDDDSYNDYRFGDVSLTANLTATLDDIEYLHGKFTVGENGLLTVNKNEKTATIKSSTNSGVLDLVYDAENQVRPESLVISSGRIDIQGFIEGTVDVESGATYSPGNSVGVTNVTGDVIIENGVILFEFGEYPDGDSNHDVLNITDGSFSIESGIVNLLFENGDVSLWSTEGAEYLLVSDDGFASETIDLTHLLGNYHGYFGLEGRTNGLYLIGLGAPVPEPSTWALLILGAAGLLYVRKRK